ncbi:hypothetical protein [Pleurochrysis sp. endemic virus 1b]|uniref:DUF927 domain-containing protein n=3 Tax=Chrysotila carterae TaxID=13221 RepID=A0A7S4FA62_CHRCT|nr:hypothetical protein [Pleurochrysis sp. endemic virus 1b]
MEARRLILTNATETPKCEIFDTICEELRSVDPSSFDTVGAAKALGKLFDLAYISYGQLQPVLNPPISSRAPPANEKNYVPAEFFESYQYSRPDEHKKRNRSQVIETYVQAPASLGGEHYELTSMRGWPFKMKIVFTVDAQHFKDPDLRLFGVELTCGYVTTKAKYALMDGSQAGSRVQCVRIRVGDFMPSSRKIKPLRFVDGKQSIHNELCVAAKSVVEKLFYQRNWPVLREVAMPGFPPHSRLPLDNADVDDDEHDDDDSEQTAEVDENGFPLDVTERAKKAQLRYNFIVEEDCLCVITTSAGNFRNAEKTETRTKLCNFYVVKILNIYQFTRGSHAPYHKLLCRHHLADKNGTGTVYLAIDDVERSPKLKGFKYMEVEVLVDLSAMRTTADLRGVFKSHHSHLDTGVMTLDHLGAYMLAFQFPLPDSVITQFGRQQDGVFVAGNCAFGNGEFYTHADAGYSIVPKFFSNQTNGIERDDYPRHIIIPYPHVRYAIGVRLWTDIMPRFFHNNLVAARATFCMSIVGLQASKVWAGQTGFGHGMPFTWVFSTEPNTGKTEAALLAQCMLGFFKTGAFTGDSTKPAIIERLSLQRDLSLVIDDVVTHSSGESRAYATLGRTLYDQSSRTVCTRTHRPYSSAIFTSNGTINDNDKAFMSRMILINFDALSEERVPRNETQSQQEVREARDTHLTSEWNAVRELMSALAVDFESILLDGKLDKHAIQDCATFMQIAIGRYRDRNANLWGLLLYYMLLTNYMFQCDAEDQEGVFEWMISSVTRAAFEYTNHASLIDQFVLAVEKVRADKTSGLVNPLGPIDQTLSWDKMRTDLQPGGLTPFDSGTIRYIALRIDATCTVLEKVLNQKYKPSVLQHAFDKLDWCVRGFGKFYDTATQPWPIARNEYVNGANVSAPVAEGELEMSMLKERKCVYFRLDEWNKIVDSVERTCRDIVDYKSIEIFSRCPKIGRYNLFELACGHSEEGDWFGYRALVQCTFAKFCGTRNLLYVGNHVDGGMQVKPEISVLNDAVGFGPISELYKPQVIRSFFDYDWPDQHELPPAYVRVPFKSRNGPDDDEIMDNNDVVLVPESPPPSLPPSEDDEGPAPVSVAQMLREMARNKRAPPPEPEPEEANMTTATPLSSCESRAPLGDITNDDDAPNVANKSRKRRRPKNLIDDEAEDEDGNTEEEEV